MNFDDLVTATFLSETLQGIWNLQESLSRDFDGSKVTISFHKGSNELHFEGIERPYVNSMLSSIEEDLKTQLRDLGISFKSDPVAEEPERA